jgi:hypothetical protein
LGQQAGGRGDDDEVSAAALKPFRHNSFGRADADASAAAIDLPIPEPAPVTTATDPSIFMTHSTAPRPRRLGSEKPAV